MTFSAPRQRLATAAAVLPILVGSGALIGWLRDISALTSVVPGWPSMKVNTALGFALAGISLWISITPDAGHTTRLVGAACAVVVGLIGLLTLTEYILNRDFGIDQILFKDLTTTWAPGRPGVNSAFQFLMLSLALLFGSSRHLSPWLAESFGLIVIICAFIVLLGYLYDAAELTNDASATQMALHSAVTFMVLGAGVLARETSGPVMQVLTSSGPGGSLARKLLPRLIIGIVVIGAARLAGQRAGWYSTELGLSLFVLMSALVITSVTLRYARATDESQANLLESGRRLRDAFAQVRSLSVTAERSREAERTRIAREIHDELGQALTGIKMDVAWVRSRLPQERAIQERFDAMAELLEDAVQIGRRISSDLRPGVLDDLGLVAALQWQAREFTKRTGISVKIDAPEDVSVPDERATAAFRICQEALTNVSRHSSASRVQVEVIAEDHLLSLVIRDNGRGFDTASLKDGSFGLLGMRERAETWGGNVQLESGIGAGTTVTLTLPLGEATA